MKNAIPVFMYHHILPYKSKSSVFQENFENHIRFLKKNQYNTVNCNELYDLLNSQKIDRKYAMLTFDDGWLDNYLYVFPIIKKYNMKITIFVNTDYIVNDEKRCDMPQKYHFPSMINFLKEDNYKQYFCNLNELMEMHNSGLVDIQSHTANHNSYIKDLENFNENKSLLKKSLLTSKQFIETNLKKKCEYLAWPWGIYNSEYVKLAKDCGYKMLFTVEKGTNCAGENIFEIKRNNVKNKKNFWFGFRCFVHTKKITSDIYMNLKI